MQHSGIRGRHHSPSLAALAGLLCPGAGQAYNGHPIRGACALLISPLLVTWALACFLGYRKASAMQREGGRFGKGGFLWLFLHAWLTVNFALAILAGLSMWGVIE